jgi:hypothetical protein
VLDPGAGGALPGSADNHQEREAEAHCPARSSRLEKRMSLHIRWNSRTSWEAYLTSRGVKRKPMISQEEFVRFVDDYNADYVLLLTRASRRHYDCLITSFMVLKDFYNMIQVMFDKGQYVYQTLPYPFSFRADEALLRQLGFDDEGLQNIYGFLAFVKETQGMEFEDFWKLAHR